MTLGTFVVGIALGIALGIIIQFEGNIL